MARSGPAWLRLSRPVASTVAMAVAVAVAILLGGGPLSAADLSLCRTLREQRAAIASEAMQAELTLVQRLREQICPQLNQQAEAAHAGGTADPAIAIDYQALLHCRHRAEQRLERQRPLLYTNRRGFRYYTAAGARLARQADAKELTLQPQGCGANP